MLCELPGVLLGKRMRAAGSAVGVATDGQKRVTNRFGIEPAASVAPHELIAWIGLGAGLVVLAGQLISAREHDLAMQLLDRPAAVDELLGEIVEQLRMRGRLALLAEIIGCRD